MTSVNPKDLEKLLLEQFENCPVCYEPFGDQILQCTNSHLYCTTCAGRLERHASNALYGRCASCREPVNGRNRQGEEIRSKFTVTCKNEGCSQKIAIGETKKHSQVCMFEPIQCSMTVGSEGALCNERVRPSEYIHHIKSRHTCVVKPARNDGDWFVNLKQGNMRIGNNCSLILENTLEQRDIILWCPLREDSSTGLTRLTLVPCSPFVGDTRRVWFGIFVAGQHIQLGHVCRVTSFQDRFRNSRDAPSVLVNWSREFPPCEVKVVVRADPFIGDKMAVCNPLLREPGLDEKHKEDEDETIRVLFEETNSKKRKRGGDDDKDEKSASDEFNPQLVMVGDKIDAKDYKLKWYSGTVVDRQGRRALIHFHAWSNTYDEWVDLSKNTVAPLHTHSAYSGKTPPGSPERRSSSTLSLTSTVV